MPKPSKKRKPTEKKPAKKAVERSVQAAEPSLPAIPFERYCTMLIQVCGYRIVLQELLEYLKEKSPELVEDLEMCLGAEESLERRIAQAAVQDYPEAKHCGKELPSICVHR